MSTGWPKVCIGTIAAIGGRCARLTPAAAGCARAIPCQVLASACGSMPSVRSSLSTKCGIAPQ